MANTLTYKGYKALIEYSAEDEALVGHFIGVSDIVGFHATDTAGIEQLFREAVEYYVVLDAPKAGR